jgi:PAS domain S-box-containing protein/putative nucleotidyltransferase with HDIG domain
MDKPTAATARIALLYALFGAIWIAVSDRALEALVPDPHALTRLQSYKGWVFVGASAALIYGLVRRELHARASAEEAMRSSEERYRTLIALANDAILLLDAATGTILDANRKAEELFGLPRERLVGMSQLDLHPQAEQERCRRIMAEAIATGKLRTGTACSSHRDGRTIPTEVSLSVIELAGRTVVLSIVRDVSEREEAEELLRREKVRAQTYLDVAGVILVVIGADERVTLINRKGAAILGAPENEIIGANWFDAFVPATRRDEVRAAFRRLMAGEIEPLASYENPVVTRGGAERLIAWNNALIRDEQGRITATLSSGEDITERAQAEAQARTRLGHLAALHEIDLAISSSLDLRVTLARLVDQVREQFHVDAADVLLLDPHTQTLEYAAGRGFRTGGIERSRLRMGEGIAGVAALERRSLHLPDLLDPGSGFVRGQLLEGEGFVSLYDVPLVAKGNVQGVLETLHRSPLRLDEEQLGFLEALASQAAIAIDNARLFDALQRSHASLTLAYDATLGGWARALDLRDQVTERHTERVTEMTVRLARELGMSEEEIVHVRRGALLHDIGKIGVPDSILKKPGPLTPQEWEIMRNHPRAAFEMLYPIAFLRPALDIPYCHHERWDGSGYPRGLKGGQIPLAARIFALADVWDAIQASDRPYRSSLPKDRACEHIRSLSGTHLDPEVVEVFQRLSGEFCT